MESGVSVDSLLPSCVLSTVSAAAAADYESSDAETTDKSAVVDDCHSDNVDKKVIHTSLLSTDNCFISRAHSHLLSRLRCLRPRL